MRLIDADKLRFRHQVKLNTNTTRPYTLNCISFDEVQNAPTIKAIPIEVLDKIRAEINDIEEGISSYHNDRPWVFKDEVLQIIDKYRAESEDAK